MASEAMAALNADDFDTASDLLAYLVEQGYRTLYIDPTFYLPIAQRGREEQARARAARQAYSEVAMVAGNKHAPTEQRLITWVLFRTQFSDWTEDPQNLRSQLEYAARAKADRGIAAGDTARAANTMQMALREYEQAEKYLLPDAAAQREKLGLGLSAVASKLIWREGTVDSHYNADAERILEKAVQWLPGDGDTWYRWAVILDDARRHDQALAAVEKATALICTNSAFFNTQGVILNNLKRYEEAIASFDRAIALDSTFATPHHGKGNVLSDLKRYEEAIATYDRAIALDSTLAYPHSGKGNVLKNLKRYEEAIASYDRTIALDSMVATPHYNKGLALEDLQRYREALASFERGKQLDPQDPDYDRAIARVRGKLKG